MPSVGVLILLVAGGLWMCIKARAAGPAAVFAALTVLFVVSTPVGSLLPGAVGGLLAVIDSATSSGNADRVATTAVVRR
jgi:hypothetical protein